MNTKYLVINYAYCNTADCTYAGHHSKITRKKTLSGFNRKINKLELLQIRPLLP